MFDKKDFIYKYYWSKQRNKKCRVKLYRIICDFCKEKQGYAPIKNKINYCKKCQYKKLSNNLKQDDILTNCEVCGKELKYQRYEFDRAIHHFCSNKCAGIFKRKNITEVNRSRLKLKLLQFNVKQECVNCGHNHLWKLETHHIIFVCDGGSSELFNLEFLCRNCHADLHYSKGNDKGEKLQ